MPRKPKPKGRSAGELPTKDDILSFLQTAGSKAGKREIARHFGVKGNNRIALKSLLTEMADEGLLTGNRKGFKERGKLPPVCVLEIVARDKDGELVAEPAVWDTERGRASQGAHRRSQEARPRRAGARPSATASWRASPASPTQDVYGYRYEAEPIKRLPREKRRSLGIFRTRKGGGGVIDPVDRKELKEWPIAAGDEGDAKDGDLVRFDLNRAGRFGVPQARVVESLGNPQDQRKISLIAVHAHGIPDDFPEGVLTEAAEATAPSPQGRVDLRDLDAADHRSRRCARPRRCRACRARRRSRRTRTAGSCTSPSPTSPTTSVPAAAWIARHASAATPSTSPTASCRCCPSASPTTCARCARARCGPAWSRAWCSTSTAASAATPSCAP